MPLKDVNARRRYTRLYARRYRKSPGGKQKCKQNSYRYNQSEKGKKSHRKIRQSAQRKKWLKKWCASRRGQDVRASVHLKYLYGITLDDKRKMYRKQRGKCKLCNKQLPGVRKSATDHNHRTGKVRGLLHDACNFAIGFCETRGIQPKRIQKYLATDGR
jgi:Recombination endonuclease VII